ncbi:hypothetical protein Rsub_10314 [Raphidocelis subcapitata]|uniref:Senescence domain-containing protein n=1 Tax=Raphidocelis subcapitata TaxID=307507 RepID=A0A2V0PM14_9CHLO|nr:hypothetical protein Rsub_10314 [Raphidocelis subcapitata]|eukprot:GBF98085.1 hypothetical protein Rsub_10314 [Raphidocelis subcapitata]
MSGSKELFRSSQAVECYSVNGEARTVLVEASQGEPLLIEAVGGTAEGGGQAAVRARVGKVAWPLLQGAVSSRSCTDAGVPTFIFSSVDTDSPELIVCVAMPLAAAADLDGLAELLGRVTKFHATRPKGHALQLPGIKSEQVAEVLRKGAEDTQAMLQQAGKAAANMFAAAAEAHKKYAPKPTGKPLEVCPALREKIAKSKAATEAGAEAARQAQTGMRAVTREISSSLLSVGAAAAAREAADKEAGSSGGGSGLGLIGKELLGDVMAVRGAMISAAGEAWVGFREAARDVFQYQYGDSAAEVVSDAADVIGGIASIGTSMKLTPAAGW